MTDILPYLKQLKHLGPKDKTSGICGNLINLADEGGETELITIYRKLDKLFLKWPGNAATNPVEGDATLYTRDSRSMVLWKNPRRHALLDWLIKELERERLLDVMKQIKQQPARLEQGICGNLRTIVGDVEWVVQGKQLRTLMDKWPDALPNRFYPIEGKQEAYMLCAAKRTLWKNPRRIALLDWIIKELENG